MLPGSWTRDTTKRGSPSWAFGIARPLLSHSDLRCFAQSTSVIPFGGMVRRAFLLLWLSGCTILNSPDEARIHRVEVCDNQIDDEGDELIDCGDPDCLSHFE